MRSCATWACILGYLATLVSGALVNVTYDDTKGDGVNTPSYQPLSVWTDKPGCIGCRISPDASQAHNGTWTGMTVQQDDAPASLTFDFQGTAIALYFIFEKPAVMCNFSLDGQFDKTFRRNANGSAGLSYNNLVYFQNGLDQTKKHTITANPFQLHSYINFDYAIISVDDSLPSIHIPAPSTGASSMSSKRKSTIGAIVGGTVGGVLLIALVLCLGWIRMRRARRIGQAESSNVDLLEGYNKAPHTSPAHKAASSITSKTDALSGAKPFKLPYSSGPDHVMALKNARHQVLETQGRQMRDHLRGLQARQSRVREDRTGRVERENAELRAQIVDIQQKMRQLETVAQSSWAQGHSDDPPPGYSPHA